MPTTLSPVDISNVALSKVGVQGINSLSDTSNTAALACNINFNLCYLEVSRSARWNCLLTTAVLPQIPQTPIPTFSPITPGSFTPWTPNTFFSQGLYVSYGGQYYLVLASYTSSATFAADFATGVLQLWNSNGNQISNAIPWAPLTNYQANAFLSYNNYYYQVNYTYTSSTNFTNDVTAGYLSQTDQQYGSLVTDAFAGYNGSQYASGWPYQYQLPSNFQLLAILNGNSCWDFDGAGGDDYEIMGAYLFANQNTAVIQYVPNQPDTTQFDAMFTNALTYKLASAIATQLRQDGGKMEAEMLEMYNQALRSARTKNAGEGQPRRFNPIRSSRFNQARYGGVNG